MSSLGMLPQYTYRTHRHPVPSRRIREIALIGLSICLAVSFAFLVPRGLPYDEPSHWLNVLHVATYWTLPYIGDPDVSYEAQQGPLAYFADALVYSIVGGGTVGFYVVRLTGVVWLAVCAWSSHWLVVRAFPTLRSTAAGGVAIVFANPMLLACAMSIQNDIPALALALYAVRSADQGKWSRAGLLIGLSALTKLTYLIALVPMAILLAQRASSWRPPVGAVAITFSTCSWWMVRNIVAYGDPTGRSAVDATGTTFSPLGWHGLSTIAHLGQSATTYLWLPVEYFRNVIHAPVAIRLTVAGLTAVILVAGLSTLSRTRTFSAAVLVIAGGVSVAFWATTAVLVQAGAFRLAYLVLPLWAAASSAWLLWLPRRIQVLTVAIIIVALNVWILFAVRGL
jgi:hypothetical protein